MRIVSKGREACLRMLGQSIIKDVTYRRMRYVITESCEQGLLLLNTITGELVLLDDEEESVYRDLPSLLSPGMKDLVAHYFLVPEDFNEVKLVDQLRAVLRKIETSRYIIGYTILPTSACNARCFYCYESDIPYYSMTPSTADKVVDYIVGNCGKEKKVSLHWFGGEPTLGVDRIDQICEGLEERKIVYESTMISNGYLFSEELAQKAKDKWNLKSIQITLDGTEKEYNKIKSYINPAFNPYKRVLDNIAYLLDQGVRVSVRMNLGFYNADDLIQLIDELSVRFKNRNNFRAYVHELFDNQGVVPFVYTVDEKTELIDKKRFSQ